MKIKVFEEKNPKVNNYWSNLFTNLYEKHSILPKIGEDFLDDGGIGTVTNIIYHIENCNIIEVWVRY